ncbi:MAG: hypothetical protein ACLQVX_11170 [Limisphaerales bacterium]
MKRNQRKLIICLAIAGASTAPLLAPLSTQGASMSILVNGDFESPGVSVNSYNKGLLPNGWYGNPEALFNVAPGGWGYAGGAWPGAESGSQYVDLGHSVGGVQNVLSQAFSVSSAANYDLTWYDNTAAFPGHTYTTTYSVEVINNVNSQVVAGGIFNAQHEGVWTLESLDFNLAAGNYTLEFLSQPVASGALLDNISLVDPPAVPEVTSTLGLAAIALWGLGMLRRKLA